MLSYRIRKARIDLGLNQAQLAELLDVSRTAVVNWETGYSNPKKEIIEKISAVLDVSKDWLCDSSNDEFEEMEVQSDQFVEDKERSFSTIIGARLRYFRKRKGLTLEQVAKVLNCALGTVQGYETRGREPNFETLIRLAELYDMSIDHLLGRDKKFEDNPFDIGTDSWVIEMLLSDKRRVKAMEKIWETIKDLDNDN